MSFKHCCCCGRHLDTPYILMKPIGRTRKIPYCEFCAGKKLIPARDIALMGTHYEDLPDNLKLVVREYCESKNTPISWFNSLVDELETEWLDAVDTYYGMFGEDLKLLEEVLLQDE